MVGPLKSSVPATLLAFLFILLAIQPAIGQTSTTTASPECQLDPDCNPSPPSSEPTCLGHPIDPAEALAIRPSHQDAQETPTLEADVSTVESEVASHEPLPASDATVPELEVASLSALASRTSDSLPDQVALQAHVRNLGNLSSPIHLTWSITGIDGTSVQETSVPCMSPWSEYFYTIQLPDLQLGAYTFDVHVQYAVGLEDVNPTNNEATTAFEQQRGLEGPPTDYVFHDAGLNGQLARLSDSNFDVAADGSVRFSGLSSGAVYLYLPWFLSAGHVYGSPAPFKIATVTPQTFSGPSLAGGFSGRYVVLDDPGVISGSKTALEPIELGRSTLYTVGSHEQLLLMERAMVVTYETIPGITRSGTELTTTIEVNPNRELVVDFDGFDTSGQQVQLDARWLDALGLRHAQFVHHATGAPIPTSTDGDYVTIAPSHFSKIKGTSNEWGNDDGSKDAEFMLRSNRDLATKKIWVHPETVASVQNPLLKVHAAYKDCSTSGNFFQILLNDQSQTTFDPCSKFTSQPAWHTFAIDPEDLVSGINRVEFIDSTSSSYTTNIRFSLDTTGGAAPGTDSQFWPEDHDKDYATKDRGELMWRLKLPQQEGYPILRMYAQVSVREAIIQSTGSTTAGSDQVTGVALAGLQPGMRVQGEAFQSYTIIESIDSASNSITLSTPAWVTASGAFTAHREADKNHPPNLLVPGTEVHGSGIVPGTTIVSVNPGASGFTMSHAATASGTVRLYFWHGDSASQIDNLQVTAGSNQIALPAKPVAFYYVDLTDSKPYPGTSITRVMYDMEENNQWAYEGQYQIVHGYNDAAPHCFKVAVGSTTKMTYHRECFFKSWFLGPRVAVDSATATAHWQGSGERLDSQFSQAHPCAGLNPHSAGSATPSGASDPLARPKACEGKKARFFLDHTIYSGRAQWMFRYTENLQSDFDRYYGVDLDNPMTYLGHRETCSKRTATAEPWGAGATELTYATLPGFGFGMKIEHVSLAPDTMVVGWYPSSSEWKVLLSQPAVSAGSGETKAYYCKQPSAITGGVDGVGMVINLEMQNWAPTDVWRGNHKDTAKEVLVHEFGHIVETHATGTDSTKDRRQQTAGSPGYHFIWGDSKLMHFFILDMEKRLPLTNYWRQEIRDQAMTDCDAMTDDTYWQAGTGVAGSAEITGIRDTDTLVIGMKVSGYQVPSGTTIIEVVHGNNKIKLDRNLNQDLSHFGVALEEGEEYVIRAKLVEGTNVVELAPGMDLPVKDMAVSATDFVPEGSVVESVNREASTFKMSLPADVSGTGVEIKIKPTTEDQTKFVNLPVGNPDAEDCWYGDWWKPISDEYGGAETLGTYFGLVEEYAFAASSTPAWNCSSWVGKCFRLDCPPDAPACRPPQQMGEFLHFMSAAAGENLKGLAAHAFLAGEGAEGGMATFPEEWEDDFTDAKLNYASLQYNGKSASYWDCETSNWYPVILYEQLNQKGACYTQEDSFQSVDDRYMTDGQPVGTSASSVRIQPGYMVGLLRDDNKQLVLRAGSTVGRHNIDSSWEGRIKTVYWGEDSCYKADAKGGASVFSDQNYQGGCLQVLGDLQNAPSAMKEFPALFQFRYDNAQSVDNSISSARISAGKNLVLYDNENFSPNSRDGDFLTISTDTSYVGNSWDNDASSLRLLAHCGTYPAEARLYQHDQQVGGCTGVRQDVPDLHTLSFDTGLRVHNHVSSFTVLDGVTLTMFERVDYKGESKMFRGPGTWNSMPTGWNDEASSVRLRASCDTTAPLVLYRHVDREGGCVSFDKDIHDFQFHVFDDGSNLNDQVSGFDLRGDCHVTFFKHHNHDRTKASDVFHYYTSDPRVGVNEPEANDSFSSFALDCDLKCREDAPLIVYLDRDFGGPCAAYWADENDLWGHQFMNGEWLNDAISSFELHGHCKASFWHHADREGAKMADSSDTPWVTNMHNDSFSSFRIKEC